MSAIQKLPDLTPAEIMEKVLLTGDLAKLSASERVQYYARTCESVGLNPLTRPLEYISLNNKLILYARKDATDQLRNIHDVSVLIQAREVVSDCYVVTSQGKLPNGRTDESIGAVNIAGLKGEALANAMMKAETKSKRRVTLSICGMGLLDESEIESIPGARVGEAVVATTEAPRTFGKPAALPVLPPLAELVESATQAQSVEYIDRGMQVNFNRSFREALPKEFQLGAEKIRHTWLADNGFVGNDTAPTSTVIRKLQFEVVRDKAIAFAKEYKGEVPAL